MEVICEVDLEDVERMYPLFMSLLAPRSSLWFTELGICVHGPLHQCRMLDRWIRSGTTMENILTYQRMTNLLHSYPDAHLRLSNYLPPGPN